MKPYTIVPASNIPNKLNRRWNVRELTRAAEYINSHTIPVAIANPDHDVKSIENVIGRGNQAQVVQADIPNWITEADKTAINKDGGFYELQINSKIKPEAAENIDSGLWLHSSMGFLFEDYKASESWEEYSNLAEVLEVSFVSIPAQRWTRIF